MTYFIILGAVSALWLIFTVLEHRQKKPKENSEEELKDDTV